MYVAPGTVPLHSPPPVSSQGAYYPSQPPSYLHAPPIYSQSCPPPQQQHLYYSSPPPPQVFTAVAAPPPPTQIYYASPAPPSTVVMPTRTVEVNRKEGLSDGDVCCLAGLASLAGIFCISAAKERSSED